MLQAKLIVVSGEVTTREVSLKLPALIGRGKEATLKVPMALVSRKHCEIRERDGRLYIRDLGSLNGTFVNNYKITTEQPLLPGEQFTVGSLTFRAEYQLLEPACSAPQAGSAKPTVRQPNPLPGNSLSNQPGNATLRSGAAAGERQTRQPLHDSTIAGTLSVQVTPGQRVQIEADPTPPSARQNESSHRGKAPAAPGDQSRVPPPRPVDRARVSSSGTKPKSPPQPTRSPSATPASVFDDFPLEVTPQKSISLSSLDELPRADLAQVSFVGNLDLGSSVSPAISIESAVQIDLGANQNVAAPSAPDDSQLGSFLRKLGPTTE